MLNFLANVFLLAHNSSFALTPIVHGGRVSPPLDQGLCKRLIPLATGEMQSSLSVLCDQIHSSPMEEEAHCCWDMSIATSGEKRGVAPRAHPVYVFDKPERCDQRE